MLEQSSVVFNIATDKVNVVGIFHRLENYRKRISHFLYGKVLVHASEIAGQRERSIPGIRSLFIRWITDI